MRGFKKQVSVEKQLMLFLVEIEILDFKEALKLLAEKAGI